MYVEFGVGEWFADWVFLYAFSHQVQSALSLFTHTQKHYCYLYVLILLAKVSIYFGSWFICALAGTKWYGIVSFLLGSIAFSGFFTYEVCRKLDPTLPKV